MVASHDPGKAEGVVDGAEGLDSGCDSVRDGFWVGDVDDDGKETGFGELKSELVDGGLGATEC